MNTNCISFPSGNKLVGPSYWLCSKSRGRVRSGIFTMTSRKIKNWPRQIIESIHSIFFSLSERDRERVFPMKCELIFLSFVKKIHNTTLFTWFGGHDTHANKNKNLPFVHGGELATGMTTFSLET